MFRLGLEKDMDKCTVIFFINERILQYKIEVLLNNVVENYLSDLVIPSEQKVYFPLISEDEEFFIIGAVGNRWKIVINGEEIREKRKLFHGDYVEFLFENFTYSILLLDREKCVHGTNKFAVNCGQKISIGRLPENNIVIDINNSVSRKHAVISIAEDGAGHIEDLAGSTGVYLNRKRIISSKLVKGDIIEIMGSAICYMGEYLIVSKNLSVSGLEVIESLGVDVPVSEEKAEIYYRTPRIFKSLERGEISIDAPPQAKRKKEVPFILTAGPSLTMSVAMMASFGVTLSRVLKGGDISSVITSGVMMVSMLLGALMWPTLLRKYNKKQELVEENYRQKKYREYLEEKEEEIKKIYDRNRRIWNENLQPSIQKLSQVILDRSISLWERTSEDEDFLEIRLGIGERNFETKVSYPEKKFELYDDILLDEAIELGKRYAIMKEVPLTLSLLQKKVIGLVGRQKEIENTLRCMILNITALHSPEDVKICVLCNELQQETMSWVKELPHCWNESKSMRYFAVNNLESYRLSCELEEMIQEREERLQKDDMRIPHIIVFVLDERIAESVPIYRYLIDYNNKLGISSVFVAEQFSQIPKECTAMIQNEGDICGVYVKNEHENKFLRFQADSLSIGEMEKLSHSLSKVPIKVSKTKLSIPEGVSFLDMYKAANIKELLIKQRWENSMPDKTLAVPIGVKAGGDVFSLDIHQDYHGCHGLVAGMTGSGKSEFLQAYILSAIMNYSPNELAFVLVDFKGGDMARPFLGIPHLAATISNLSGNILYRALVSLEAEIKAREKIFNDTATILGIDKINIDSYQKYFKEERVSKPLPHLVIIIDEFAQLKSQHPEFMSKLIDIAQVGRSLGIHLILATQKPSGLVSPQIWSNSRFKISLKVLDKQDSKEMINRPDAALIKQPGRAFVQVGYDEVFEQFQSGYSGADYIPKERYQNEDEVTVKLIDSTALPLRKAKNITVAAKSGKTQLEEIVKEIIEIGRQKDARAKHLWLDLLKEELYLEDCIDSFDTTFRKETLDLDMDISCICGMLDVIETQQQIPYEISFVKNGHLAVYGASGTGKTTFIQTLVFSLVMKYSPELLHIFALDFGGRNLGNLSALPHCVNVAFGDEEEKISYIFEQILSCIEERKLLFAENNCATYESYLAATQKKLPAVLLILDGYAIFREKMFSYEEDMIRIAANAKTYGVFLVLTANSRNAIYYKVSEHIANNITFRMNDKMNYRDLLSVPVPIEPENVKGRGLVVYNQKAVEMQVALPIYAVNEAERLSSVNEIYANFAENLVESKAVKQYATLEKNSGVLETKKSSNIVSGTVKKKRASVLPTIEDDDHTLVFGVSSINGQLQGVKLEDMECIFIGTNGDFYPYRLLERIKSLTNTTVFSIFPKDENYICGMKTESENEIHEMVDYLEKETVERAKDLEMLVSAGMDVSTIYGNMQNYKRVFLVIEDFCKFFDVISDEDLRRLLGILKKQKQLGIYAVTIDNVNRMTEYSETGLYTKLVKAVHGMIIGGGVDDTVANKLYNQLTEIATVDRTKTLMENQAFMYIADKYSVINLD